MADTPATPQTCPNINPTLAVPQTHTATKVTQANTGVHQTNHLTLTNCTSFLDDKNDDAIMHDDSLDHGIQM